MRDLKVGYVRDVVNHIHTGIHAGSTKYLFLDPNCDLGAGQVALSIVFWKLLAKNRHVGRKINANDFTRKLISTNNLICV